MTFDDIKNLDTNNLGTWPTAIYLTIALVVFIGIGLIGFQLFIQDQFTAIERERRKEPELKQLFEIKQLQTANLAAYRQQFAEMQQRFGSMLAQLPDQNEIPELLKEISQARQAANLDEVTFEIQAEISKEFYAEKPIALELTGRYHNFGQYVATIASLPRIVTLSDIRLTRATESNEDIPAAHSTLSLNATAKTYRYIEQSDDQAKP